MNDTTIDPRTGIRSITLSPRAAHELRWRLEQIVQFAGQEYSVAKAREAIAILDSAS